MKPKPLTINGIGQKKLGFPLGMMLYDISFFREKINSLIHLL
uniref:Uncharacterized protein n=1 Tax=Saccharolobus solfataricus (strain 98/2) TaxID=555311 RepID=D0KQY9_SACS9